MKRTSIDMTNVGGEAILSSSCIGDGEVARAFDEEQRKFSVQPHAAHSVQPTCGADAQGTPGDNDDQNQVPGQDVVGEVGHAAGLQYGYDEPLNSTNRLEERDLHRWELDPASAEDYSSRHVRVRSARLSRPSAQPALPTAPDCVRESPGMRGAATASDIEHQMELTGDNPSWCMLPDIGGG